MCSEHHLRAHLRDHLYLHRARMLVYRGKRLVLQPDILTYTIQVGMRGVALDKLFTEVIRASSRRFGQREVPPLL